MPASFLVLTRSLLWCIWVLAACWSLDCCWSNNVIFSSFVAVLSAANIKDIQSSQKAACECSHLRKYFLESDQAAAKCSISSSYSSNFCNGISHSESRVHPHAYHMMWGASHLYETACMFTPWSSPHDSHKMPSIAFKHVQKGLLQVWRLHWSHVSRYWVLNVYWATLSVKTSLGLLHDSCWQWKLLGPPTAFDSS